MPLPMFRRRVPVQQTTYHRVSPMTRLKAMLMPAHRRHHHQHHGAAASAAPVTSRLRHASRMFTRRRRPVRTAAPVQHRRSRSPLASLAALFSMKGRSRPHHGRRVVV
ncbi:unnamed protein product [Mortierella alpina]